MSMRKSTVTYTFEKSTKGTHLYVEANGGTAQCRNVYVVRSNFDGQPPTSIKVTIEEA